MMSWIVLGIVALAASLALVATFAAWRVRTSTPRTISLGLSAASCAALVAAAAPVNVELPTSLCTTELVRTSASLSEQLHDTLDDWSWWLRPCRRLKVIPKPDDYAGSIDVAELSALAARYDVAVDVMLGDDAPSGIRELVLVHERGFSLPLQTPIHLAETESISPRFADAENNRDLKCRLDDGADLVAPTLFDLLDRPGRGDEVNTLGFHALRCRVSEREDDEPAVGYVRIKPAAAQIVTSDRHLLEAKKPLNTFFDEDDEDEDPAVRSYRLHLVSTSEESSWLKRSTSNTASVLILDRPQRVESCEIAHKILKSGGTVVVAMPSPQLACSWFPAESVNELEFDRHPRLTFLFDGEFASDLRRTPTFDLENARQQPTEELQDSLKLQWKNAARICRLAGETCRAPFATWPQRMHRVSAWTRDGVVSSLDGDRLRHTTVADTLTRFYYAGSDDSSTLWENERIVVYTHDPLGISVRDPTVSAFLERTGAHVDVAMIQDHYGLALHNVYGVQWNPARLSAPSQSVVSQPMLRFRSHGRFGCPEHQHRCVTQTPIAALAQTRARAPARRYSRFWSSQGLDSKAPVRFGWWNLVTRETQPRPTLLAETTTDAGMKPRPLAIGAMVGRGHLLFLTYSPFEGWLRDEEWLDRPLAHEDVLGGSRLIETLYQSTEYFLNELDGPITSVELQPDGALWVQLIVYSQEDELAPDLVQFSGRTNNFVINAHLVDFDKDRNLYTFALPAEELEKLSRCEPLQIQWPGIDAPAVHACPPSSKENADAVLKTARALELLARYSGGRVLHDADEPPYVDTIDTRALGLCGLCGLLLLSWGRRAKRRLLGASVHRTIRRVEQTAQRRYDPPDAVVAAAGDWDGRTSTWPRTGTFGGYRPLEPGDRVSAVVLDDLIVMQQGKRPVLPRVAQRIEEAAPAVAVLVSLGASMRVPERRNSSKALFAGRVAMQVAASAWKIRGQVSIRAAGVRGDAEIIAPTCQSPGHETLEHFLKLRLRQRPTRDQKPWATTVPDCGALVYISDFQLEDERVLLEWLSTLESRGTRVGGVMVYSPLEFTMIEGGRLAGSGVWVDRSDWDPDDVFTAFSRRRDAIERVFDSATTGGLITAATSFTQDDIELALEDGRLLQILR